MALTTLPRREAGVLLHPTSLPSGQLDADVYRWLDWLAEAHFKVWQVLPLGVPLAGLSPYLCASAFALNPALFPDKTVDQTEFTNWYQRQQHWVDDYALFMTLKAQYPVQDWSYWPVEFAQRQPHALSTFKAQHQAAIEAIIQQQFNVWAQWQSIRDYATERGIRLFGDMPIFVSYDSADVWAHPERFRLDDKGHPNIVTGVPPDYFSETGQRWGNPHYDWQHMQSENFQWWCERISYHFECFDLVRIDHFRGLEAAWEIPASEPTAMNGHWGKVPGEVLLSTLQQRMGALPLVAEDLGVITPEVTALRDQFDLPGMGVLQFAFDYFEDNPHKPQNVRENTVYYTGTHDNDTLRGWYQNLSQDQRQFVMQALWIDNDNQIIEVLMATLLSSRAHLTMLPWQDLLNLDSSARMNTPGTMVGNWTWRFSWQDVPNDLASQWQAKLQQHKR
jgi:4-alpha-glucanotransferase